LDQAAIRCVLLKDAIRFAFRVDQFTNTGIEGRAAAAFERCVAAYVERGGGSPLDPHGVGNEEEEDEEEEEMLERTSAALGGTEET